MKKCQINNTKYSDNIENSRAVHILQTMAFNNGFSTYNSNQFLTDTHIYIYIYIHHRNSFLNWSQKWHVNDRKKITICYKYRYFFWQFFFTDLFRPSTQNTNILYCKHIFLHKKTTFFSPLYSENSFFFFCNFFLLISFWLIYYKKLFYTNSKKYKKMKPLYLHIIVITFYNLCCVMYIIY